MVNGYCTQNTNLPIIWKKNTKKKLNEPKIRSLINCQEWDLKSKNIKFLLLHVTSQSKEYYTLVIHNTLQLYTLMKLNGRARLKTVWRTAHFTLVCNGNSKQHNMNDKARWASSSRTQTHTSMQNREKCQWLRFNTKKNFFSSSSLSRFA